MHIGGDKYLCRGCYGDTKIIVSDALQDFLKREILRLQNSPTTERKYF